MSLLSALVPLLRVYRIGLLVMLHQLRRHLRPRCPPAPGEDLNVEYFVVLKSSVVMCRKLALKKVVVAEVQKTLKLTGVLPKNA
ncbi:hypothetical protein Q9966_015983 [Columba livia]|nr:hypothetical protein Q9966_015983 [Columba livia]